MTRQISTGLTQSYYRYTTRRSYDEANYQYVYTPFTAPNASRFTPFVSTDLFYRLGEGADQLRNKIGVTISVARHQKLDVFGFTDYQFIERQKNELILGATYRLKF